MAKKEAFQKVFQELNDQIKKAEKTLGEIQQKLSTLDKESARAELNKAKLRLQEEIVKAAADLAGKSERIKSEVEKARGKVQTTLLSVKDQVKVIAENERLKRRGKRRSS
jgi:hypothetical protein